MCKILLRYSFRNHLDQVRDFTDEFESIQNFRNYLRWVPERAMAIGYSNVDADKLKVSRSSNVRLSVLYKRKEIFFEDAAAFGQYLKDHPEVARALRG